jgi:large subunit ribosomal protein L19
MTNFKISKSLLKIVEDKHSKQRENIKIGDLLKISYAIPEGTKERMQIYEGLLISIKNRGLGKSITIRKIVNGIGIEQVFPFHSPKITSIFVKQSSKVRRAKLYFVRKLYGKAFKLKRKM